MILLIDVGNTSLSCAIIENDEFIQTFRVTTFKNKTSDEYFLIFKEIINVNQITNVAIASVVPQVTYVLNELFMKHFNAEVMILEPKIKTSIKVIADNPREVGADLICDASGLELDEALIIDLGTATKYMYVKNKTIMGLAIAPGIEISIKALVKDTALLPEIDLKVTKKILCNNTINCMQSGVINSAVYALEGFIKRIREEVNNKDLAVVATGGLSNIIIQHCNESIIVDELLTLKGLYKILKKNLGGL